jgi:hypothetical protein
MLKLATPTIGERINRNGIFLDTKDNVVTNKLTYYFFKEFYYNDTSN